MIKYILIVLMLTGCATSTKGNIVLPDVPNCIEHGGLRGLIWNVDVRSYLIECADGTVYTGRL